MKHLTFLLLLISFQSFTQIKGIVKDKEGRPVSFTNVCIENIGLIATTDLEGRFSFPDEAEGQMLVIYGCGFEIKKIRAEKSNDIGSFHINGTATGKTEKSKKNPFSGKFGEPAISLTLTD